MEILEMIEALAKNPLLDISILESSELGNHLVQAYRNSESHRIRELIANNSKFPDMTHGLPVF